MVNRVKFIQTFIDDLTMDETVELIEKAIQQNEQLHHTVINAAKVVALQKDLELRNSVNSSDIINADGQAIVWGANILGKNIRERVAGIDLMEKLVETSFHKNYKIYLLGAQEDVVSALAKKYEERYGAEIIAGFRNGYFTKEQEKDVMTEIANSGANMLFVAISSPKKENLLYRYKNELRNVNFIMGVGGSFDVIAGKVKRAPVWMQKNGLEWFFRFLQEPKRMWRRYLVGNTKFIALVLKEKIKKQH